MLDLPLRYFCFDSKAFFSSTFTTIIDGGDDELDK